MGDILITKNNKHKMKNNNDKRNPIYNLYIKKEYIKIKYEIHIKYTIK